jgi:hypothetical protein
LSKIYPTFSDGLNEAVPEECGNDIPYSYFEVKPEECGNDIPYSYFEVKPEECGNDIPYSYFEVKPEECVVWGFFCICFLFCNHTFYKLKTAFVENLCFCMHNLQWKLLKYREIYHWLQ